VEDAERDRSDRDGVGEPDDRHGNTLPAMSSGSLSGDSIICSSVPDSRLANERHRRLLHRDDHDDDDHESRHEEVRAAALRVVPVPYARVEHADAREGLPALIGPRHERLARKRVVEGDCVGLAELCRVGLAAVDEHGYVAVSAARDAVEYPCATTIATRARLVSNARSTAGWSATEPMTRKKPDSPAAWT